jgi:hypothetical protein
MEMPMRVRGLRWVAATVVLAGVVSLASLLRAMPQAAQPAAQPSVAGQGPPAGARGGARAGGRGAVPTRKRLLAWADTRNGVSQHDSVSHALAIVERLGYDTGLWDTLIRTDSHIIAAAPKRTDGTPASGGPSLAIVDAILFLGHRVVPLEPAKRY